MGSVIISIANMAVFIYFFFLLLSESLLNLIYGNLSFFFFFNSIDRKILYGFIIVVSSFYIFVFLNENRKSGLELHKFKKVEEYL